MKRFLGGRRRKSDTASLGAVTPEQAAATFAAIGIDADGFTRVMDSGHVRHIMKSHGSKAVEALRKPPQLPIAPTDFGRIPRIVREGRIVKARQAKPGRTARVTYEAVIGRSRYVYVEEARPNARQLAVKTLWKFRAKGE